MYMAETYSVLALVFLFSAPSLTKVVYGILVDTVSVPKFNPTPLPRESFGIPGCPLAVPGCQWGKKNKKHEYVLRCTYLSRISCLWTRTNRRGTSLKYPPRLGSRADLREERPTLGSAAGVFGFVP